jgi:hypothetical protein
MIFWFISALVNAWTRIFWSILQGLLCGSFLLTLTYFCGWWDRGILWVSETQATKLLNDTPVTVGSLRLDWTHLLCGQVTIHASNIILHMPKRDQWQWSSPVLARIGSAQVECNLPITLFNLFVRGIELPIELYTVRVSDVQVFVERQQNIFNFYLLDRQMILPDPELMLRKSKLKQQPSKLQQQEEGDLDDESFSAEELVQPTSLESGESGNISPDHPQDIIHHSPPLPIIDPSPAVESTSASAASNTEDKEQAQQLVQEMLQAVKTLGRAAQKGSLQGAIQQQGHHLADKLRIGYKGKETLQKSVKVMQHVSQVAVESLQKQKLEQWVPERTPSRGPPPPKGRVGCILLSEIRIFTRDSWITTPGGSGGGGGKPTTTTSKMEAASSTSQNMNNDSNANANATSTTTTSDGWNKPILIHQVLVRSSELCPPMSLKDENGLPAVYQPLDKVAEVVSRRIVAEMAKSNTGRLFSAAMGEVVGLMKTSTNNNNTTKT